MSFEWYIPNYKQPCVSIAKHGITLSTSAVILMGNPQYIMVGYKDKNILVFKICNEKEEKRIKLHKLGVSGCRRLANKGLIRFLINNGLNVDKSKKYNIVYEKKQDVYIINI